MAVTTTNHVVLHTARRRELRVRSAESRVGRRGRRYRSSARSDTRRSRPRILLLDGRLAGTRGGSGPTRRVGSRSGHRPTPCSTRWDDHSTHRSHRRVHVSQHEPRRQANRFPRLRRLEHLPAERSGWSARSGHHDTHMGVGRLRPHLRDDRRQRRAGLDRRRDDSGHRRRSRSMPPHAHRREWNHDAHRSHHRIPLREDLRSSCGHHCRRGLESHPTDRDPPVAKRKRIGSHERLGRDRGAREAGRLGTVRGSGEEPDP